MAQMTPEERLERRNARRKLLGLPPVTTRSLSDNINKIIDGCPSCKKRRDSKTLDR